MLWWEIVIILLIAAFATYIVIASLIKKKKGKVTCTSNCSCCSHSKECQNMIYELRKEFKRIKESQ